MAIKRRDDRHEISFLAAFLGLVIAPYETTETLLTMPRPKYGLRVVLTLFMTILIPIAAQMHYYQRNLYHPKAIASLMIVIILTIVIFTLLENVFLRIIGIKVNLAKLTSTVCYSIAPLVVLIWIMYLLNYLATGNLSFLTIVLNGQAAEDQSYTNVIPWALTFGVGATFFVFFFAIRFLGDLFFTNALIITFLSLIPFYAAFVVGVLCGELINPGTLESLRDMLETPMSMINI